MDNKFLALAFGTIMAISGPQDNQNALAAPVAIPDIQIVTESQTTESIVSYCQRSTFVVGVWNCRSQVVSAKPPTNSMRAEGARNLRGRQKTF